MPRAGKERAANSLQIAMCGAADARGCAPTLCRHWSASKKPQRALAACGPAAGIFMQGQGAIGLCIIWPSPLALVPPKEAANSRCQHACVRGGSKSTTALAPVPRSCGSGASHCKLLLTADPSFLIGLRHRASGCCTRRQNCALSRGKPRVSPAAASPVGNAKGSAFPGARPVVRFDDGGEETAGNWRGKDLCGTTLQK